MNIDKQIKYIAKKIKKPIVTFDIESSGLNLEIDEIISFSAIRISSDGKSKELNFTCKPKCPINPNASKVNGFTEDFVDHLPPFKNFIKQIQEIFDKADICTFNGNNFDIKILDRQLKENGINDFFKDKLSYDTYTIFTKHNSRKLAGAVKFYTGKEAENSHDSLGDVKSTILVLAKQLEMENIPLEDIVQSTQKKEEKPEFEHIIEINKEHVLNFSKHKGSKLKDCEKGFLEWILAKDFPKNVKEIVKKYL